MEKSKLFLDVDKETKWLNEMAERDYRFTGKSFWTYQFEEDKDKYTYYIDVRFLMKKKQSEEFCQFIDSCNVRVVKKQLGLYYFEADYDSDADGIEAFYTDRKSIITYYLRNILILIILIFLNISIISNGGGPYFLNISFPLAANSIIMCVAVTVIAKHLKQIYHILSEW